MGPLLCRIEQQAERGLMLGFEFISDQSLESMLRD